MADNYQISVNGFTGGMSQDISKFKFDKQKYYFAQNIHVITEGGLSTGSIENIKGTRKDFVLPDLTSYTYTEPDGNTVTVPALSNLKILGGTSYLSKVIVFSTAEDSGTWYSQVWMFEYDEESDQIINLAGNSELDPARHLMYNRALDMRPEGRVQAWCRVESDKFFRVYWTDGGLNNLRSINLAPDPFTNYPVNLEKIQNTPQGTIDIITTATLRVPQLDAIYTGNLPNGRICYFYRMISRDGAITTYSPTSDLIDLNAGNIYGDITEYPETYLETRTTQVDEKDRLENIELNSEKAVKIRIENLDRNYDYIQVGYIIYKEQELAELFLFPEQPYNKNDLSFEFIHDGNEEQVYPLTLEEFTAISNTFEKPKVLTPKNNWLFVANTQASYFDVHDIEPTFDSRAYRFNQAGVCALYDTAGPSTTFNAPNWPAYGDELDAINPDQLVYNRQGTNTAIIGGEGPVVKYRFSNYSMLADKGFKYSSWYHNGTTSLLNGGRDFKLGPPFINASVDATSYDDLRSPFKSTAWATHARGEIYRYGLVFTDKQGRESYVEWVGDIKMPDYDAYPISTFTTNNDGELYVNSLGIEFTIDLSNHPTLFNHIQHVKIVRVKRDEQDMTRLGTGVTGGFCKWEGYNLTYDDIIDAFCKFLAAYIVDQVIKKITANGDSILTVVLGAAWATIKNNIANAVADILKAVLTSATPVLWKVNQDDYSIKMLIRAGVAAISGLIPGIGGVLNVLFGNQITEYIYDKVSDIFKVKVAGIGEKVYALHNWNFHGQSLGVIPPPTPQEIQEALYGKYSSIAGKDFGYVISPVHQFDRYNYVYGDKVRVIGTFDNDTQLDYKKIVQVYHRNTETGIFNRTHSTAALRRWYNGDYSGDTRVGQSRTIDLQKTLDVGEMIYPNLGSDLPDAIIANCHIAIRERYTDQGEDWGGLAAMSRGRKVMGIGDKKHLIKVDSAFPTVQGNTGYIDLDQQDVYSSSKNIFNGITRDYFYQNKVGNAGLPMTVNNTFSSTTPAPAPIGLKEPRVLDGPGDYMISYERELVKQYGGNDYVARTINTYEEVLTVDKNAFTSSVAVIQCFRGDAYVGLYDAVNYNYYFEQYPGYDPAIDSKKSLAEIFPAEAPFNFNLREGKHFAISQNVADLNNTEKAIKRKLRRAKRKAKRLGIDMNVAMDFIIPKRFLYDEFTYDAVYHQSKSFKKYYPKPAIDISTTTTTNRIWRSQPKIDGELIDSWRVFKPVDYIEVEGVYGPINNLITFRDQLLFYQTNAIGTAITNERSAVTDSNGQLLQMATSQPFSHWQYLSTETGSSHRFGVVPTNSTVYHVDSLRKKIFKFEGGFNPISDEEQLQSLLRSTCQGNIVSYDQTLGHSQILNYPIGVHGEYFPQYNRVLFTFLNNNNGVQSNLTLGYNQMLQAFETSYSFTPGLYLKTASRLITADPANPADGYTLFTGNWGEIFGTYTDSYITIINNGERPYDVKTFNNLILYSEVYDSLGANLPLETISSYRIENDYQDTGTIALIPSTAASNTLNNLIIRQERKWFVKLDTATGASENTTIPARMRDFYAKITLTYTNNNNKRFILHDILTKYIKSDI